MGKKTRKKIMAGILCLIILLLTGCSGKKEESDTRSSLQSGEQTEEAAGEKYGADRGSGRRKYGADRGCDRRRRIQVKRERA